jgi:prepilin-type N-terminal cleavage/methylation domain-containing protein/prepilin-type processing-associated H-X9-DG protein
MLDPRRLKGFTLIELLVVVAIIALLISILLPSLSRARDQVKSVKCMANMRDMWTGANTFAAAHRNRFQLVTTMGLATAPTMGHMPADSQKTLYEYEPVSDGGNLIVWPIVLLREEGIRNLRRNSDWGVASEATARLLASRARLRRFEVLGCPSDTVQFASTRYPNTCWGYLSYGINEDITGARTDGDNKPPVWKDGIKGGSIGAGERLWGQLDKVVRPSEVAFFFDAGSRQANTDGDNSAVNLLTSRLAHGPLIEYADMQWDRLPYQRHRGGSLNITYADGHGGFVKRVEKTPANPSIEPKFAYTPKTRISPYNSGTFPVP